MKLQILLSVAKVLLVTVLLVGTFSYAMFQGGFVSWFLFYSFLPFGLYSLMMMVYPLNDFNVVRVIKSRELKAGANLTIKIHLKRTLPFPLFYLVAEEHISGNVFQQERTAKKLVHPWFKREIVLEYEIQNIPRGEHTFESVELKTGDFLGLVQKSSRLAEEQTILVYPSHIVLDYQPLQARFDQGVSSSNVKIQQDTTLATGVRDYETGDRVSWIHWKSFARTNDLKTKEFEERKSHDVMVVLDRTPTQAFEDMVVLAASVIRGVIRKGAQAGYFSKGEQVQFAPLRSGESHQKQIDYYLAKVKPDQESSFETVLKQNASDISKTSALILITSKLTRESIDEISKVSKNSQATMILFVKHPSVRLDQEHRQLAGLAASKGIVLRECDKRQFASVFKEVKQA
ncbi:hypothetical protein JMA_11040 [Jeotgalibacillus malaysiensis]|uniref:DUF58 domain-containing protein n=1 Tax=Jeotgalibacillus malaysiensis TaxID=1508404 RepID=A0A0B5AK72_9BACL|nr:DUF58 domain-containing protein [Jeotgalibacillus malaysiensis]AJD90421.1 hypothetical protein JMA_11040 [Jeotgalibacillus malaysiensis]